MNPDEYEVFKPLLSDPGLRPILEKRLGAKEHKMVYAGTGGATRNVRTSKAGRAAFVLSDDEILALARQAMAIERHYASRNGEQFFDATQNAHLVTNAERFYRMTYYGSHELWNLRDRHMFETLQRVLAWAGPDTKAVVWAHNSHIGDARLTYMGSERGELNIGQLCREHYGRDAALIGFGTHSDTVAAASEWDAPMEIKAVRPSRPDSYEALCRKVGVKQFLLTLRGLDPDLRRALAESRLERYIGDIYRGETERLGHYSHASLTDQFDAFVWFVETNAVTPLPTHVTAGEDETYPFGL